MAIVISGTDYSTVYLLCAQIETSLDTHLTCKQSWTAANNKILLSNLVWKSQILSLVRAWNVMFIGHTFHVHSLPKTHTKRISK